MEQEYKYTVCTRCFTYNQASYIGDALNGFAMQQTSFPVVNVIIDDSSTDGEQVVLKRWADNNLTFGAEDDFRYKELSYGELIVGHNNKNANSIFVILLLKENHYQTGRNREKFIYISQWTDDSKYQAECEGDDYWIDPLKLQKQYDALESHPEVDMCACCAKVVHEGKEVGKMSPTEIESILSIEDVIRGGGGYLSTNTLVYRSALLTDEKRVSCYRYWHLDYFLQIDGALRGGIYYLPDEMAVYRKFALNSWTSNFGRDHISFFNHKYNEIEVLMLLDSTTEKKCLNL